MGERRVRVSILDEAARGLVRTGRWVPTKTKNREGLPGWRDDDGNIVYQKEAPGGAKGEAPEKAPQKPSQKVPESPRRPVSQPSRESIQKAVKNVLERREAPEKGKRKSAPSNKREKASADLASGNEVKQAKADIGSALQSIGGDSKDWRRVAAVDAISSVTLDASDEDLQRAADDILSVTSYKQAVTLAKALDTVGGKTTNNPEMHAKWDKFRDAVWEGIDKRHEAGGEFGTAKITNKKALAKNQGRILTKHDISVDSAEMGEMAGFKKTVGDQMEDAPKREDFATDEEFGAAEEEWKAAAHRRRNPAKLQKDFLANMNPGNYESREAFEAAKERISDMSPTEFDKVFSAIATEEEEA